MRLHARASHPRHGLALLGSTVHSLQNAPPLQNHPTTTDFGTSGRVMAFSSIAVYFPYHGTAAASSSGEFFRLLTLLFRAAAAAAAAAATAAVAAAAAAAASFASRALDWISRVRSEPLLPSSSSGAASRAAWAAAAAEDVAAIASRRSARAAAPAVDAARKWARHASKESELVRWSCRLIYGGGKEQGARRRGSLRDGWLLAVGA